MKAKSKEIKDLLNREPLLDIRGLQQKILDLNFSTEQNEYTLNEAVVDFENLRSLLIKSIDGGILDNYSYQVREDLFRRLNQMLDFVNRINGNRNVVPSLLDEIQNLKNDVFITLNLDTKATGLFDYKEKLKELTELQQKYNSLLVELDRATNIYERTKSQITTIEENHIKSKKLLDQHVAIDQQMQEKNKTSVDITNKIHKRFDQVDSQSTKIREFSATIDTQKEELSKADERTKELINKNEELEERVDDLIGSAVGGALGKTFGERKSELRESEIFWKRATFASIIILFIAAGAVFYELFTGVNETTVLLSKISLLVPASVAVWFTSSNYNRERKLLEEYAFKSTMALSLDSYRRVLNEELGDGERNIISEFLVSSMQKIYSSPLENIANHSSKDDEIEISMLDRIVKIFSKVTK